MGKKSNSKAARSEAKSEQNIKSGKNNRWLILAGAVVMIGIVWVTLRTTNSNSSGSDSSNKAGQFDKAEKPPVSLIATLSPDMYSGKARAAYQAAKDIPEILAQLPCFCGCMEGLGHKSNLYCFADTHGSICDLCQNIALDAKEMHRKGIPIEKIRDNIRTTYGNTRM
jgi:hypothetical protein